MDPTERDAQPRTYLDEIAEILLDALESSERDKETAEKEQAA
jgi:hypothetical protein